MKGIFAISFAFSALFCLQPATGNGEGESRTKFAATSDFAFDFYKQLASSADNSKNIIFSPLSIYVALAMLKAGARRNTAHEMEKVLKWQKLIEKSGFKDGHEAVKSLMRQNFQAEQGNNTVTMANKLWMQKYFCSRSCNGFINQLKANYDAELGQLNFVRAPEKSRKEINQWVEDKTNKKIKDLLPDGSVNALTRFVLTNAIYFKGMWESPFDKKDTTPRDFTTTAADGSSNVKKVPTMFQNTKVYVNGFNPASPYQFVELPYQGGKLSMLIIMPKTASDFRKLEATLSSETVGRLLNDLYEFPKTEIDVFLPKFKFTTSLGVDDELKKMGMGDVFDSKKADLSGITGYRGMYVSKVVHKAFVSVDEEGTEAAAATGIIIKLASLPFQININKPFLFMIRDSSTGVVLFVGRVMDPTMEE